MRGEPGPEVLPVAVAERLVGRAWVQSGDGFREDVAEEMRKLRPAVAAIPPEELGCLRVLEHPRLVLCEDAVARERSENPVESVGIRALLNR